MNDTKFNQRRKILQYCAEHGSITVREASDVLRMNSASKRISELRQAGYDIQDEWEININSSGEKTRYKRYFINEPVRGEAR